MTLNYAESVLLLALDDIKGRPSAFKLLDPGLTGGPLLDLLQLEALRLEDKEVHPVPGVDIEHPVLARAYTSIAESSKTRNAKGWVWRLATELKPKRESSTRPWPTRYATCGRRRRP